MAYMTKSSSSQMKAQAVIRSRHCSDPMKFGAECAPSLSSSIASEDPTAQGRSPKDGWHD
jgi:hypothetical protein